MSETATLGAKIAKACLISDLTPDEVLKHLQAGGYRQFARNKSIIVASLMTGPLGPGCRVILAAGDAADIWSLHDDQVVPWAKENGRAYMIGKGRLGWQKEASKRGYKDHGRPRNSQGREMVEMVLDL